MNLPSLPNSCPRFVDAFYSVLLRHGGTFALLDGKLADRKFSHRMPTNSASLVRRLARVARKISYAHEEETSEALILLHSRIEESNARTCYALLAGRPCLFRIFGNVKGTFRDMR